MELLKGIFVRFYLYVAIYVLQQIPVCAKTSVEDVYRNILKDYIPNTKPCVNCSESVRVNMKFTIMALNKVDEILGEFSVVAGLTVEWSDKRLSWNPEPTNTDTLLFLSKDIWVPPLLLSNPFNEVQLLTKEIWPVRAFYHGKLIWISYHVFNTKCEYNILHYPYDNQTCYVVFHPAAYHTSEVSLVVEDDHVTRIPDFDENGEWELGDASISTYEVTNISVTEVTFNIKRRPTFFIVNIIVPLIFISVLNCFGFVIPPQNGERISYSVSVLLSLTVFMSVVNISIPKTSAPMPNICFYLTCVFVGSFFTMLVIIFNTHIYFNEDPGKVPGVLKCLIRLHRHRKSCIMMKAHQNNIDNQNTTDQERNNVDDNGCKIETETLNWRDLSLTLDKICFIISILYVTVINVAFAIR